MTQLLEHIVTLKMVGLFAVCSFVSFGEQLLAGGRVRGGREGGSTRERREAGTEGKRVGP